MNLPQSIEIWINENFSWDPSDLAFVKIAERDICLIHLMGSLLQQLAGWCTQFVIWSIVIGTLEHLPSVYKMIFRDISWSQKQRWQVTSSRAWQLQALPVPGMLGTTSRWNLRLHLQRQKDITVVRNKMKNGCLHHTSDSALGFQTLSNIPGVRWLCIPSWHHVKSEGMCHALGFRRPWVTDHWEMLERQTSARERAVSATCSDYLTVSL